ncbi:MAG: hypothetical protein Q8K63_10765, partial [Acidimicrobiales bacterium]|nr:hypothetical protein [Acidimicrobiales bacterium]
MADIPDHLLKKAAERRAALEAQKAGAGGGDAPAAADAPVDDGNKIPAHLLQRSAAARAKGGEEAS